MSVMYQICDCEEIKNDEAITKNLRIIIPSDQTKLWFRFWFYRNPKVWVSTETVFQPKPKPKLKFFGILALFPKYLR